MAEQCPKYGCPTLHDMLVIEGEVVNKKRTYRIYCEEGLQVRTKKRKKISRPRVPMHVPDAVKPKTIVCDNGPEFASKAMYFWAKKARAKLHFIQPGKPTQNAFVESFNGKMREYCLNLYWFSSIEDARSTIDDWQRHYNHVRPHRSLGKIPPAVFAKEAA